MSIELRSVSHRYGDTPVLTDVDFTVSPAETVAIVGPSGSGKTTMLSILGGLLTPTNGEVLVDGRHIAKQGRAPTAVRWVFQTINLLGRRTALDNVRLGLHALGRPDSETTAAAEAMLAAVGLAGFEEQPAMRLSGGEAQRVGIARALAARPRYVLADEPTGQLDHATSELIAHVLFAARPRETAIVTATHDRRIAERCDRECSIVDGRLVWVR
ncbi:MAG: ATP-binding cassette domain-containing protein [Chloroflexota bacterium]